MKPYVFILEPCEKYDVSAAREYGSLIYLFPVDGSRSGMRSDKFSGDVRKELEGYGFNPNRDFIVVAGTVALAVAFVAIVAADFGRVNLLLFDAKERRYFPLVVINNARQNESDLPADRKMVSRIL